MKKKVLRIIEFILEALMVGFTATMFAMNLKMVNDIYNKMGNSCEIPYTNIEAPKKAPLPTGDIQVFQYVILSPNNPYISGYVSQVFEVNLDNTMSYSFQNFRITVSPNELTGSLGYGYIDFESSADPYYRVQFYYLPNATATETFEYYPEFVEAFRLYYKGNKSYEEGYNNGYDVGYNNGNENGYNNGYSQGYSEGIQTDTTVFTIFNGILNVAMLPINVLLTMMDFEILGINISNFVMSILTVCMTIIVIRMFMGGKNNE